MVGVTKMNQIERDLNLFKTDEYRYRAYKAKKIQEIIFKIAALISASIPLMRLIVEIFAGVD